MIQLLKNGLALTGVKGDATIVVIGAVLIASMLIASSLQRRRDERGLRGPRPPLRRFREELK